MNEEVVSTSYSEDLRNLWKGYEVFFLKNGGMVLNKKGEIVVGFNRFIIFEEYPSNSDEQVKILLTKNILEMEKERMERINRIEREGERGRKTRELVYGTVIHKTETDNLINYAKTLFDLDINYSETESDLEAWGYSPNTKEIYVVEGPFELNGFLDPNDFLEKVLELHPNSKGIDKLIQIEEYQILMLAEDYRHDLDRDVETDYILEATDKFLKQVQEIKEKIKVLQERKKEIEALEGVKNEENEENDESEEVIDE